MSDKSILSFQEAQDFLSLSSSSLYKLTSRKKIPHYKPQGRIYFKKTELEEWVLNSKVPTATEVENININNLLKR